MTKPKKIFLLLFIIAILVPIYIIPHILIPLAKDKIRDYLQKSLKTDVSLGRIGINLFTKSIILEDLGVENFLEVDQIVVRPELLPLFRKKVIISKISLDEPRLILNRLANGETNWDFLWQRGKIQNQPQNRLLIKELLIKDGIFFYKYEFSPKRIAVAESHGIFIHLKNYPSPISYIQDVPFYTRIKGKGYLPTEPKGSVSFSGNANLFEKEISITGDVSMHDISLTYFNDFYPENSQIQVISGKFSLSSQVESIRNQLKASPNVTIRNLQLKLTKDYTTGDVFELPIVLVVDFFDLYKEELKFSFEVIGTLTNPKFQLEHVVAEKVSEVIGESIVRTIATSPRLVEKLGDKLLSIGDRLKNLGLDIGKGAGKAIKQLEKPVSELIKGLKGQ